MSVHILGLDPAFRYFGWAQVEYTPGELEVVVDMGVILTKKADKKRKVRDADDLFVGAQHVIRELDKLLPFAQAVATEEMGTGHMGKRAAKLSGLSWMAVAAMTEIYETPTIQIPVRDIKTAFASSKEEIMEMLNDHFSEDLGEKFLAPKKIPEGQHSHAYDALAAVLCSEQSDVIRALAKE